MSDANVIDAYERKCSMAGNGENPVPCGRDSVLVDYDGHGLCAVHAQDEIRAAQMRALQFIAERDEARDYVVRLADGLKELCTPFPVTLCRDDREHVERYRRALLRGRDV